MLILPLFILLIFGIVEVWKVMAVRQSLHLGVYKAARWLSWQGPAYLPQSGYGFYDVSAEVWESRVTGPAETIVRQELDHSHLLPAGYALHVQVFIEPDRRNSVQDLGWLFTVRAELVANGLVPFLSSGPLTLTEQQVSFIDNPAGHWRPWDELPEGWPY